MATLITCDRCRDKQVVAHYRVTFERIGGGLSLPADHPQDLCKEHYEQIWAGL